MKLHFADIDNAIKAHIADEIAMEKNKELEELVFFASYTIQFDIFRKATLKLKKILRQKLPQEWDVWKVDATKVIKKYHLDVSLESERYAYLLQSLIKAQIKINEAVMLHFKNLCKKAHSSEYIESHVDHIYKLLLDDIESEDMFKTSSPL